jgi:hypothetical protein
MRQPWLQREEAARPRQAAAEDDFSPRSTTLPLRGALIVLGIAVLLLAAGRSAEIASAAYGLPLLPGSETLIGLADRWDGWMDALGVKDLLAWLREVLAIGRA